VTERGWSWFMGHFRVHSQNQGWYVCYLMHRWARLLLVPRNMVLDPTAPTKTLLPVDGYQIVVERGDMARTSY